MSVFSFYRINIVIINDLFIKRCFCRKNYHKLNISTLLYLDNYSINLIKDWMTAHILDQNNNGTNTIDEGMNQD